MSKVLQTFKDEKICSNCMSKIKKGYKIGCSKDPEYLCPECIKELDKPITKGFQAREYFKPLTYEDITEADFWLLVSYLSREFEQYNDVKRIEDPFNPFIEDMKIDTNLKRNFPKYYTNEMGYMKCAYIKVNFSGSEGREAISFNQNGFIGFAGWACSENVQPMLNAFKHWVYTIKQRL